MMKVSSALQFGKIRFDVEKMPEMVQKSLHVKELKPMVDAFNQGPNSSMEAEITFTRVKEGQTSWPTFKVSVPSKTPLYYHIMSLFHITGQKNLFKNIEKLNRGEAPNTDWIERGNFTEENSTTADPA